MIAGWMQQVAWTKPPAGQENAAVRSSVPQTPQAVAVAQTTPEAVMPKTLGLMHRGIDLIR